MGREKGIGAGELIRLIALASLVFFSSTLPFLCTLFFLWFNLPNLPRLPLTISTGTKLSSVNTTTTSPNPSSSSKARLSPMPRVTSSEVFRSWTRCALCRRC